MKIRANEKIVFLAKTNVSNWLDFFLWGSDRNSSVSRLNEIKSDEIY